jgi:FAD/FMN-containing dehydrogenase
MLMHTETRASILAGFQKALGGRVIDPDHGEYDEARAVYFTGLNRYPIAVVRPVDASDVARALRLAAEAGIELAIRSGGHSIAGHSSSDGIVLDLSALRSIEIDVEGRSVWAGAGLTAGEHTKAVGAHGLATGFGDAPSVGVGGITLGGGVGYLHRKYGLTIDSLLAAEVVTADGEVLITDADSHPDLFWAIRGGGGNFGVVTKFRYQLHDVDEVYAGMLLLPASPRTVVDFLRHATEAAHELSGMINVTLAPPLPFLQAKHHGKPVIMAALAYAGDEETGERVVAPFRGLATPLFDTVQRKRYRDIYEDAEPPPSPVAAMRSFFMDDFDIANGEAVLDHLQRSTARMRVAQFRVLGGAVARVSPDATAFAHRDRAMMCGAGALFDDPGESAVHQAWAADLAGVLRHGAGAYVGFLGDEGDAGVRDAYPGPTYERLRSIKTRYDSSNLFRLNQNVPPA